MTTLMVVAYGHDDCDDAGDDGMVDVAEATAASMRMTTLTMMTGPAYTPTALAVCSRSRGQADRTATREAVLRPSRAGSVATRYGRFGN